MTPMPEVTRCDLWTMLLCTFRYAFGRMSYIVGECGRLYDTYRDGLEPVQREQLAREIEEALARAEAVEQTVGMGPDHLFWRGLAVRIRHELAAQTDAVLEEA